LANVVANSDNFFFNYLAAAPNIFERELEIRIKLDKNTHIDMSSGDNRINGKSA